MSQTGVALMGAIAGFTIFLGLPLARARSVSLPVKGFLNAIATGVLLFLSQAMKAYGSVFFRMKLLLLLLAGINALIFELTLRRRIVAWDTLETPPWRARVAGILGIVLWAGVIAAGRTMAYNF